MTSGLPNIVPRWEWRAFGDRFPALEVRLAVEDVTPQTTVETWVVGPRDDINVKIRAAQLEIKHRLDAVDGLERWVPVLKAPFPITADVVAAVFAWWGLSAPAMTGEAYTVDRFLDELVRPTERLHVACVRKERRQLAIAGCVTELASLDIEGQRVQTAAVESEHPDQARYLARALDLIRGDNVNYVAALPQRLHLDHRARAHGSREGATP